MTDHILKLVPIGIAIATIIILRALKPRIKGYIGEQCIALILSFLPKKNYRVLHDVTLAHKNGQAQIDHIVVSKYGIFVIETKNFKGWIFGSEDNYNWTQSLYKKKFKFYNPILQNQGHIYALKQALPGYKGIPFISIVVFMWNATLKLDCNSIVIKYYRLYFRIRTFRKRYMDRQTVSAIYDQLKAMDGQHYEYGEDNKKCPSCSGALITKYGKYGQFRGCRNYPQCRYTVSLQA